MDVAAAEVLLGTKLEEHGLASLGWTGGLDNARRRFGVCQPNSRSISLSRHLVKLNDDDEVLDTILHEIAHALAFEEHGENCGHDFRWKALCVRVGARPERCYDTEETNTVSANWHLVHRETAEVFAGYDRRPVGRDLTKLFIRGR